jgi:hypothetical protein
MLIRGDDKHPRIFVFKSEKCAHQPTHTQINPKFFFSHHDRPFTQQSLNVNPVDAREYRTRRYALGDGSTT